MLQKEAEDRMRAGLLLTEIARLNNICWSPTRTSTRALEELVEGDGARPFSAAG